MYLTTFGIDADMAVINEDGTKNYVENEPDIIDMEPVEEPQAEPAQEPEAPNDAQMALFGGKQ